MNLTFEELQDIIKRRSLANERYRQVRLATANCCDEKEEDGFSFNDINNEFGLKGIHQIDFEYSEKRDALLKQLKKLEQDFHEELLRNGYGPIKLSELPHA